MNPSQRLTLYRIAVIIQCIVIFMVSESNFRYRRLVNKSMETSRMAITNMQSYQAAFTALSNANGVITGRLYREPAIPGTVLTVTNGEPKWVRPPPETGLMFFSDGMGEWLGPDRIGFIQNWIKTNWTEKAKP